MKEPIDEIWQHRIEQLETERDLYESHNVALRAELQAARDEIRTQKDIGTNYYNQLHAANERLASETELNSQLSSRIAELEQECERLKGERV